MIAGPCRNARLAGEAKVKGRVTRAATSRKTAVAVILQASG
jgi:hypothetical protein